MGENERNVEDVIHVKGRKKTYWVAENCVAGFGTPSFAISTPLILDRIRYFFESLQSASITVSHLLPALICWDSSTIFPRLGANEFSLSRGPA
jgi:hypothetical protein